MYNFFLYYILKGITLRSNIHLYGNYLPLSLIPQLFIELSKLK